MTFNLSNQTVLL